MTEGKGKISFGESNLNFHPGRGTYDLEYRGVVLLSGAAGRMVIEGTDIRKAVTTEGEWRLAGDGGNSRLWEKEELWGRSLLEFSFGDDVVRIRSGAFMARSGLSVDSVSPLVAPRRGLFPDSHHEHLRFYQNGWQCWNPSGVLKSHRRGDHYLPRLLTKRLYPMVTNTATVIPREPGYMVSEWFGAVGDVERDRTLVIGFVGVSRALSQVSVMLGVDGGGAEVQATERYEGKAMVQGEEFWSGPLVLAPGDLGSDNLIEYAEELALYNSVPAPRERRSGWCSWYQYFARVTEEEVEKNLDEITARYSHLGIEVVQLDDGYTEEIGDWLWPNTDFPGGLEALAKRIKDSGMVPGVWVAPFTVGRRSRVFREHSDWILRDSRGDPVLAGFNPDWKTRFYGLDLTRPEVLDHLRDVFSRLAGWGFRFIKLDFMASGMLEGEHHRKGLTRAEIYHRALRLIREAVGSDVYLLGAGGPIMLGVGILDAQRVGADVAPFWSSFWQRPLRDGMTAGARNCTLNPFTRHFFNGVLWRNDPDCVLLRDTGNSLSREERILVASIAALSGGTLMLSDDLTLWGDDERSIASRLFPPVDCRPVCPDLWLRERPQMLLVPLDCPAGSYHLLLVANWEGHRRNMEVDLVSLGIPAGSRHAFEFWSQEYLGRVHDRLLLEGIPGHSARVVRLTPVGDLPALVGSDMHISQGASEIAGFEVRGQDLTIRLQCGGKREAGVSLCIPLGWEGLVLPQEERGVVMKESAEGVFRFVFQIDGSRELDVRGVVSH